jgi:hypothetical protein
MTVVVPPLRACRNTQRRSAATASEGGGVSVPLSGAAKLM